MANHSQQHSIQHGHHTGHHHSHGHDDGGSLAELLDLDAQVLGGYLDEVTEWAGQHAPDSPRTVVDLGAGTGTGTVALASRFTQAEVIAVDKAELMLERVRATAHEHGLAERIRVLQADLDACWPEARAADVVWAASSLHEVASPDDVLAKVYAALNPGGLLVVLEMDSLPRFLPEDVEEDRPGLEARCHAALAQEGWNAHPNWRSHLERAGFTVEAERSFAAEAAPSSSGAGRYADGYLRRIRSALNGKLDAEDLEALDRLLAADSDESLLHRNDLKVGLTRTAWAARRA